MQVSLPLDRGLVVGTLVVIAASFAIQIAMAQPDWRAVIIGFAPTVES